MMPRRTGSNRLSGGWRCTFLVVSAALFVVLTAGQRLAAADRPKAGADKRKTEGRGAFIDRLLEESWKKVGVNPARPATDEEYLRRAYLDLLGRIPNVQEARAFLQTKETDKRDKLIDYLLDHADYPKNFATQWTILLIGRGNQGRMVDRGALASWLRKQFAANRPWNDVVYDLVTATGSNKQNGAVNYVLAHLEFDAVPLTSRTTRLFLGQQIQCTQCHDHPSNEWKQADFWGINAFFKGLKAEQKTAVNATGLEAYDHTELHDEPSDAYVRFDKRNGLVGIAFPKFLNGKKISQGTDVIRRTELGKLIVDPNNEDLARAFVNRLWAHFLGRGFVNPVDDIGPHNTPSNPELLEKLAKQFQASHYDVKQLIRWITASRAYQASSIKGKGVDKEEGLFHYMQLRPMSPEQLFDSLLTATNAHRTGNGNEGDRKRDTWLRQFLFAFGNDEGEETTNFQGTIPQALMMMNGELLRDAFSGKPGSFLAGCVEQAQTQTRARGLHGQPDLPRGPEPLPDPQGIPAGRAYLASYPDSLQVLQDLFWALLNSNEFILIH